MVRSNETVVERLLVKSKEAAAMLAVSERTLWGMTVPRGAIPAIKLGRSVRYSITALQEWLAAQQTSV